MGNLGITELGIILLLFGLLPAAIGVGLIVAAARTLMAIRRDLAELKRRIDRLER